MPLPLLIPVAIELAKHFLPQLVGKLAGNKAGDVAAAVINTATKTTGAKSPEEALAILQVNAQSAHEYRMALLQNTVIAAQLAADERADERKNDLDNVQGARLRDTDVRKLGGGENRRADYMVLMAVIGVLASMGSVLWLVYLRAAHPDTLNSDIFNLVILQLANFAAWFGLSLRDAFSFEFGSSRGSRTKDEAQALAVVVAQRDK